MKQKVLKYDAEQQAKNIEKKRFVQFATKTIQIVLSNSFATP